MKAYRFRDVVALNSRTETSYMTAATALGLGNQLRRAGRSIMDGEGFAESDAPGFDVLGFESASDAMSEHRESAPVATYGSRADATDCARGFHSADDTGEKCERCGEDLSGAPFETVNMTPTWESLMPVLLATLVNGTTDGQRIASEELTRLAKAVDAANATAREDVPMTPEDAHDHTQRANLRELRAFAFAALTGQDVAEAAGDNLPERGHAILNAARDSAVVILHGPHKGERGHIVGQHVAAGGALLIVKTDDGSLAEVAPDCVRLAYNGT